MTLLANPDGMVRRMELPGIEIGASGASLFSGFGYRENHEFGGLAQPVGNFLMCIMACGGIH